MIRIFPRRTHWTPTDELAFYGPPPLFRPGLRSMPVRVSVTFTWDKERAETLAQDWGQYHDDVQVGGPAYHSLRVPSPLDEFTPGRFMKEGCTITSRGCPKACAYCVVSSSEGPLRELTIQPGWIVQDNNLLACSESHVRRVFDMLRAQKRCIFFNGGLDKDYLEDWHRAEFDSISIGELWFACDRVTDLPRLEKAARILQGIPKSKLRCYVLLGFENESLAIAEKKVERVFELGFMPFAQLYQAEQIKTYPKAWRELNRKWARPAAYMSRPDLQPSLLT